MKKILCSFLALFMFFTIVPTSYAQNSHISLEEELKSIDYQKLTMIAQNNLIKLQDGTLQVQISDIKKYSQDAGVSQRFAEIYIRETNKVLKQIQDDGFTVDRDGNIIDPNKENEKNDVGITAIGVTQEGTLEIDFFHTRTFFGREKTEKMLNNLDNQADVFTGISLGTAFKWPHISVIAALCAAATYAERRDINNNFVQSNYRGVYHDYIKIPMGPDNYSWKPWYRQ